MSARWDRMKQSLADAGVDVQVDRKSYPGGVSESVFLREGVYSIEISDGFWRDMWTGWEVSLVDSESIIIHQWRRMKKRSEVVAAVLSARERVAS